MSSISLRIIAAVFAAGVVTPMGADEPSPAPQAGQQPAFLSKSERQVLDLTNQQRAKAGLKPVVASRLLSQVARAHARNMADQKMLAHTLDGKRFDQRIEEAGYRFSAVAENIANARTAKSSIEMWMGSEAHRRNMLNPTYQEIGIGQAAGAKGHKYWVQVFATPTALEPAPAAPQSNE